MLPHGNAPTSDHIGRDACLALILLTCQGIRLVLFALLLLFEPFVRLTLSVTALLCIVTACAFEASVVGPRFSFLGMMAVAVACTLVQMLYASLLRALA